MTLVRALVPDSTLIVKSPFEIETAEKQRMTAQIDFIALFIARTTKRRQSEAMLPKPTAASQTTVLPSRRTSSSCAFEKRAMKRKCSSADTSRNSNDCPVRQNCKQSVSHSGTFVEVQFLTTLLFIPPNAHPSQNDEPFHSGKGWEVQDLPDLNLGWRFARQAMRLLQFYVSVDQLFGRCPETALGMDLAIRPK
jgi:hypothetical protein